MSKKRRKHMRDKNEPLRLKQVIHLPLGVYQQLKFLTSLSQLSSQDIIERLIQTSYQHTIAAVIADEKAKQSTTTKTDDTVRPGGSTEGVGDSAGISSNNSTTPQIVDQTRDSIAGETQAV